MKIRLEFLWYSGRILSLLFFFLTTALWVIFGFDSTLEGTITPIYQGIGVHFSTLQAMALLNWIILSNMQIGGYSSLRQMLKEFLFDARSLFSLKWDEGRRANLSRINPIGNYTAIEALVYSGMVVLIGLFIFENLWVPLYNQFHYGSWLWPIYIFETKPLSFSFWRNISMLFIPLFFVCVIFKKLHPQIQFRFITGKALILLLLIITSWTVWISYDSPLEIRGVNDVRIESEPFITNASTFPIQGHFPQTVYTFYNVSNGMFHQREDVQAWHQDDIPTHTLNVIVKYLMFAYTGYVFAVRRKEESPILITEDVTSSSELFDKD